MPLHLEHIVHTQEAVEGLYWLNTHYFESRGVESAVRKESDIRDKMKDTLSTLDTLQGGQVFRKNLRKSLSLSVSLLREQFSYLRGKALNVLPEYSKEAETLLAVAVKRDPSLAGAWVSLGESYWKKGDVQQAHDCFSCSITHVSSTPLFLQLVPSFPFIYVCV